VSIILSKLLSYAGDYKTKAYTAILFILLSAMSEIAVFYLVYKLITFIIKGHMSLDLVVNYGGTIIFLYLCKSIFFSLGLDYSHVFAYNTLYNLRCTLGEKLKRVSLGSIISKGSGGYRQNFVDDIENVELLLAHGLPEGLPYLISCITVYLTVFIVDYRLGLLSLVTLPIGFVSMYFMAKSGLEKADQYQSSLMTLNKTIVEYISGMEVVKIFNRMTDSNKKMIEAIHTHEKFTTEWYQNNWNYMAIFQSVVPSTICAVLPVGLLMILNGSLELPVLLFCILLLLSISTPILKLMNFFPVIHNVVRKIEQLEKAFDQPEITVGLRDCEVKSTRLEFKNVSFAYGDQTVLKQVDFIIEENQKIGIVGESGSGKSTIGKLLMHYWDVSQGEVLLGGININEITLDKLMATISYVSQDNFLFNVSIKDNLRIAKPDATDDEIIAACKSAKCHDVIMNLSHQYQTVVGESGNKLSGGERQRITLARGFLKNSQIIILDEATSFTDPENDALIQEAIMALTKDKTLVTIAHKLSMMETLDKVMVVDKGKVVAYDCHENLLGNPIYKNLWNRYKKSLNHQLSVKGDKDV
jgi:ATP-binding cassette subfamily B protein